MTDYVTGRSFTTICVSIYNDDLDRLDKLVEDLKKRGQTNANRSGLIRYALKFFDATSVPPSAFERRKK